MRALLSAALCLGLLAGPAAAGDKVVLKMADTLPVTHYMSLEGAKFFMARTTELTHGDVTFEYYPSEQLGKARDLLKLTQAGVADIAYIAPGYNSEKMPLSGVAELPGLYKSSCEGTHAFMALATHGGILEQREIKPLGLITLMAWNLGPYQIASRTPTLHALSDFKGMKIRGAGGTWDLILRRLGASPVNFPAPEMREAMERGTIDGSVGPAISMKPYDLQSVAKSMSNGASFGSFASTFSMNARKFRSLPKEDQDALVQAGQEATAHLCAYVDTNNEKAIVEVEAAGVRQWHLTEDEKKEANTLLAPVVEEWGKALDERHLPGTEVAKAFKDAVK
jgi:TRAP-type C4-dicarboxylate transport system substrate-binding protein